MNEIIVGKPTVQDINGKTRLVASLRGCSVENIFFEVESKYKDYLCWEDADAFLLMLIEYAQLSSCNLVFEAPITPLLLDYVNEYYIPLLSSNIRHYSRINVKAPVKIKETSLVGAAVGTGFSAGVDSFYTVYKQLETKIQKLKLTHVLFVNVGAQTYLYEESCKIFDDKSRRLRESALQIDEKLDFIEMNTNCLQLYSKYIGKGFTGPDARKTCSCVVAMKKLFSTYYFSNGPTLERFEFSSKDPAHFDLFTLFMMSKSGVNFYLRGIETPKRIDKLKYIVDKESVQNNLSVCVDTNCGICEKCVRTEFELYAMGKLGDFKKVFDTEYFYKHKIILFAKYLSLREEKKLGFIKEIEEEARRNRIHLPTISYILAVLFFKPLYYIKSMAKIILRRKN